MVADAEGATKHFRVTVAGGRDDAEARLAARTVAVSPLVKTAVHGADPNWGRIVMALGRSGARFSLDRVRVTIAGITVFEHGAPLDTDLSAVVAALQQPRSEIDIDLGAGDGRGHAWGCDLTAGYVRINAEYTRHETTPIETMEERIRRAEVLVEALPYIRRFSGHTLVIKLGGAAMGEDVDAFLQDVVLLRFVGMRPVLVHGGGPEISSWQKRLGIEPSFVNGLRVTDAPTMEVVKMVLTGKIGPDLVARIHRLGGQAVGMSGEDGPTLLVRPRGHRGWPGPRLRR